MLDENNQIRSKTKYITAELDEIQLNTIKHLNGSIQKINILAQNKKEKINKKVIISC